MGHFPYTVVYTLTYSEWKEAGADLEGTNKLDARIGLRAEIHQNLISTKKAVTDKSISGLSAYVDVWTDSETDGARAPEAHGLLR